MDINYENIEDFECEYTDVNNNFYQIIYGESPCDHCSSHKKCKVDNMACLDFFTYVETQEVLESNRVPTRLMYIKIFCREEDRKISEHDKKEIVSLNTIRGITHKMISERFYILPSQVKKIIEVHYG